MSSEPDEIDEIIVYITGMRRAFNRKLDDHLFIMQQQNKRIDEQTRTIDDQKQIIDELAWQIRDLRDSVRKVSEQTKNNSCACCNKNENRETTLKLLNKSVNTTHHHKADNVKQRLNKDDDQDVELYENIEVKHTEKLPIAAQRLKIISNEPEIRLTTAKYAEVIKTKQLTIADDKNKRTTRYIRPNPQPTTLTNTTQPVSLTKTNNTATTAILTLPSSSSTTTPTKTTTTTTSPSNTTTTSASNTTITTNGSTANNNNINLNKILLENHNQSEALYDNRKIKALSDLDTMADLKFLDLNERDSIDDEVGDIIFRAKEYKRYSSNSKRGSSKVLCSLISDIEEDYLPHEEEITEENIIDLKQRDVVSDALVDYNQKEECDSKANLNRMGVYKSTR